MSSESELSDYSSMEESSEDESKEEEVPVYPKAFDSLSKKDQESMLVEGKTTLFDLVPFAWSEAIGHERTASLLRPIERELVRALAAGRVVYPQPSAYFAALRHAPSEIRVVILGQDPYHGPGQAHGLAFSDNSGAFAPSLRNIVKTIKMNGLPCREDRRDGKPPGNLDFWADQGIMLLNTRLTVEHKSANAHKDFGWDAFTDAVIKRVASERTLKVFCLWGTPAKKKRRLITYRKHLILETTHPSPLSAARGFLSCDHFARANEFLAKHGRGEIDWSFSPP